MTLWADEMDDSEREAAIRRATDHMVQAFRNRWAGYRVTTTQALDWPRYEVPMLDGPGSIGYPSYYANNAVPQEVKNACAELAFKAAFGELTSDLSQDKKSVTVGPITTVYADNSSSIKRYPVVERILAPLLKGPAGLAVVRC
jgi:hypothetical protein